VTAAVWNAAEFEQQLRERGRAYHIHHPFNVMLNSGQATAAQIRGWVANRFYYQISIPIKDAAILANCDDRGVRRNWVQRILDHDGYGENPAASRRGCGSPRRWALRACRWRACSCCCRGALRGRRLCEFRTPRALAGGRVRLTHRAVCAGNSPAATRQLAGALPMDRPGGTEVLPEPPQSGARDVEFALALTLDRFRTRAAQERALEVLQFKLDVLWQMNDAMALAYGVTQ